MGASRSFQHWQRAVGERNPTDYSTPKILRLLICNPKSVYGSDQKMPGFDRAMLSDPDLDAVIAYLTYMAGNKVKSTQ
jgi:hypothetical protein